MSSTPTDRHARRRAGLSLAGIVLGALTVLVIAVALFTSHQVTAPRDGAAAGVPAPSLPRPLPGDPLAGEEEALAARPMVQLPAQAAQPQTMTTRSAGPAITLPTPAATTGQWIPGGFPDSPEGAVAQLKALDETAMSGGDPQVYARGYTDLSAPGAPNADSTGLGRLLRSFRSAAGLPDAGSVADLTVSYRVTHGQIKGSADHGRYVVACVLGQLAADYRGQVVSAGVGDCQALRWAGDRWRIAPGALAAPAPSAWPGSADSVTAGYRELA